MQQDIQIIIIVAAGLAGLGLFIWLSTKCLRWRNANLKEVREQTNTLAKIVIDHNKGIASMPSHVPIPTAATINMFYRTGRLRRD